MFCSLLATVMAFSVAPAPVPRRRPRGKLRLLVIGVVLAGGLAGAWWLRHDSAPDARELPALIESGGGIEPLSLKLLASPHASRQKALYPHGGPTFGEDEYRYKGLIEIDGKPFKLYLETYEPIAAVRFQNDIYLLVRAFFWEAYGFRKLGDNGTVVEVAPKDLNPAFGLMEFADKHERYNYRVWWMSALAKVGCAEEVVQCFNEYVKQDPREILDNMAGAFCMFLEQISTQRDYAGMSESLEKLLFCTTPKDDSAFVGRICMTLLSWSPSEGGRVVRELDRRLINEHVVGTDYRRMALDRVLERMGEASSQPRTTNGSPAQPPPP